jgi:hypothetical protein
MAKYETQIKGDFEEVLSILDANIMERFSVNLVDESNWDFDDIKVGVRVYDKYYMRNGNRTSLSLTVVSRGDDLVISAIGSGGGSGVIFNFSLGAESDMVGIVADIINGIGRE